MSNSVVPLTAGPPIDVSVMIRADMPIYPGDPAVTIELAKSIAGGDPANVSRLDLGAHTGTHVDAPRHFIADGNTAGELSLDPFIGPCRVVEVSGDIIRLDRAAIQSLDAPARLERILLKTSNSALWEKDGFSPEFARLDGEGARALLDRGVRLVGIDYLSIGDPSAHVLLLSAGVSVIEGLDLRGVEPGNYFLACLPLKIAQADGAPARAVLWAAG